MLGFFFLIFLLKKKDFKTSQIFILMLEANENNSRTISKIIINQIDLGW
jgi:hypothetical protein